MSIIINLFAGPGAGKSTNATGLFSLMKRKYYNVEYVPEYAKDLTWAERFKERSNQLKILAMQDARLRMLVGNVDFIVTDGPILISTAYVQEDFYISNFKNVILDVHNSYNNFNFYLERVKKYVPIGRDQTESQARALDLKVKQFLDENNVKYDTVMANDGCPEAMLKIIEQAIERDVG